MRLLFEMDKKDYDSNGSRFVRPSARAIIVKGNRIVMVRSQKYDYYKFPGGGLEAGETPVSALIREVREEAGMVVIPESVREFGYVHRVQRENGRRFLYRIIFIISARWKSRSWSRSLTLMKRARSLRWNLFFRKRRSQ